MFDSKAWSKHLEYTHARIISRVYICRKISWLYSQNCYLRRLICLSFYKSYSVVLIVWKNRLLIDWTDEIKKLIETMMMTMLMKIKRMMKMLIMTIEINLMNIHNSLIHRRDIEIFESMFDLLRFESNEIREFADLIKTEEVETEHLEIVLLENESMQWSSIQSWWSSLWSQ